MNYHTLDRFRGAWLGSMLGSLMELEAVAKPCHGLRYSYRDVEIGRQFFILREQLAKITIDSQRADADAIADLLVETICKSDRYNALLKSDRQPDLLVEYSYCLLSLLPLIIFYGDNWNLLEKIVGKFCLKLGNLSHNSELEADTLLWSYFVTSILNSKLELNSRNFSKSIGQILTNVGDKKTALTTQLEVVIKAMERGVSLQQLSDELLSKGNRAQSAIAMSCYCFATTATDFKLSVQRATNLEPEIAGLTAALTGTVSGAYNGIAGIPLSWKKMAIKNRAYPLASQTALKLFRAWLGIYPAKSEPESNLETQAIALPNLIQTRKSLKIISQKSLYG